MRMTNETPDYKAWRNQAEKYVYGADYPVEADMNNKILHLLDRVESLEREKRRLIKTVADLNAQLHEHKRVIEEKNEGLDMLFDGYGIRDDVRLKKAQDILALKPRDVSNESEGEEK